MAGGTYSLERETLHRNANTHTHCVYKTFWLLHKGREIMIERSLKQKYTLRCSGERQVDPGGFKGECLHELYPMCLNCHGKC